MADPQTDGDAGDGLSQLLKPEDCARRLGITKRELLEDAKAGVVPSVVFNQRRIRFNPVEVQKAIDGLTLHSPKRI